MKKALLIFLTVSVILSSLSGCSFKKTFSSENNEYIISAMGFDAENTKLKIFLEAIVVNTEDADKDIKLAILEGEGSSLEEAFSNAQNKAIQPFQLSHIAVILLGESITPKIFSKIIDFCHLQKGITLSTQFVTCKNSFELLQSETVSSVAVGYDMMSMLSHQSEHKGINYKNCFYEIEALREKEQNIISIPYFNKNDSGIFINGIKIFKNYSLISHLNEDETSVYAIMTDSQSRGEFMLDGEKIRLDSSYSKWNIQKNENLELTLILRIKIKDSTMKKRKTISESIKKLYSSSKQKNEDIFGIGNIIYNKKNKIWKDIKKDYVNQFKNSDLTVEFI